MTFHVGRLRSTIGAPNAEVLSEHQSMQKGMEALAWILAILKKLAVPVQAAGGLAALAHGSRRPLVDLDFYVPTAHLDSIARAVSEYVVRPPTAHHDDWWDVVFMKIEYGGCEIELAGSEEALYYDGVAGQWKPADVNFGSSIVCDVLGVAVPVMPAAQLIAYKRALGRAVDLEDVAQIEAAAR